MIALQHVARGVFGSHAGHADFVPVAARVDPGPIDENIGLFRHNVAVRQLVEKFPEIQERSAAGAKSQKGVSRAKDPARYPLAGQAFDLTDGCGSLVYGVTNGKPLYKCGHYMRTVGAECQHDSVEGEALLRFTLQTLTQPLHLLGGREKLRQLLEQRAAREEALPDGTQAMVALLEAKVDELKQSMETAAERMTVASDDDRYEAIAK